METKLPGNSEEKEETSSLFLNSTTILCGQYLLHKFQNSYL